MSINDYILRGNLSRYGDGHGTTVKVAWRGRLDSRLTFTEEIYIERWKPPPARSHWIEFRRCSLSLQEEEIHGWKWNSEGNVELMECKALSNITREISWSISLWSKRDDGEFLICWRESPDSAAVEWIFMQGIDAVPRSWWVGSH